MTPKSFKELEHEGWQERASTYDRGASALTRRAVGPILESFGPRLEIAMPAHLVMARKP